MERSEIGRLAGEEALVRYPEAWVHGSVSYDSNGGNRAHFLAGVQWALGQAVLPDELPVEPGKPAKLMTDELEATLQWLAAVIVGRDSAGGWIQYEWSDTPGVYDVRGAVRYGNSMGQGSMRLFRGNDA